MKKLLILLFLLPLFSVAQRNASRSDLILQELKKPTSKNVLVVAHRRDWRNAPENSIQAIENAIKMGVDIVEIDIQKTKDGELVVIHDQTIDRTLTGKGKTTDFNLSELKNMFLRNGAGVATRHRIPTLREALVVCKDRVLVNIDKGFAHFAQCLEIMKETGTVNQVILKGSADFQKLRSSNSDFLGHVIYMPIVNLDKPTARRVIEDFAKELKPLGYELIFNKDTSSLINEFDRIKKAGSRVWVNSLWSSLNAGHDDDLSVEEGKPEAGWGWIISKGANIIQTDRPKDLIDYLKKRKLRDLKRGKVL